MFFIKKHPLYSTALILSLALVLFAAILALLAPDGYYIVGSSEWGKAAILKLSAGTLALIGFNFFIANYLFYRDRLLAYILVFLNLAAVFTVFMKVAFFRTLW